jgi:hypothetical protein
MKLDLEATYPIIRNGQRIGEIWFDGPAATFMFAVDGSEPEMCVDPLKCIESIRDRMPKEQRSWVWLGVPDRR